jgi:hypothetical protein
MRPAPPVRSAAAAKSGEQSCPAAGAPTGWGSRCRRQRCRTDLLLLLLLSRRPACAWGCAMCALALGSVAEKTAAQEDCPRTSRCAQCTGRLDSHTCVSPLLPPFSLDSLYSTASDMCRCSACVSARRLS